MIACFPVYRTYVQAGATEVSAEDRQHVARAIRDAKRRNRSTSESIFDFIADLLLLRDPDGLSPADVTARRDFVLRFQQLTGPVMAKGLEDTVFYRYYPLAALNEVGGRPTASPVDAQRLHAWNLRRRPPGRTRCRRPRPTTRSAARTCARGSTCCPSCRANGRRP